MNYYTGISSILIIETFFFLLTPNLSKIKYWRRAKVARQQSKVERSFRPSTKKVLTQKDEFLLPLMRLQLGLLNEDLADRFGISTTVRSNTFITMIKLLAKLLGKTLVVWLPREPIQLFIKTSLLVLMNNFFTKLQNRIRTGSFQALLSGFFFFW